jgi:GTP-binding protein
MAISAATGENVRSLLFQAARALVELPPPPPAEEMPVYRVESDPREFNIERTQEGWRVTGPAIERAAAMTYWEYDQSVRRFHRILESVGIDTALRAKGVQVGDTVFIGDFELEWQD